MKQRLLMAGLWVLCVLVCVLALVWMLAAVVVGSARAWTLAIAHDQLANAATGGSVDEMLSSRAHRARSDGRRWGCVLCRLLDALDPDHCLEAYKTELFRRQLDAEFRLRPSHEN